MIYLNAIEFIKENVVVVDDLFNILIKNDSINTITHTLSILSFISEHIIPEGVEIVYDTAYEYTNKNNTLLFTEIIQFINHSNLDIKVNTLILINNLLIRSAESNKVLQSKLLIAFQLANINRILDKNGDCKHNEFQAQLSIYQSLTKDVIKGSNYEIEIYKKKLKDLENHCLELQNKVEFVILNQKFYDEMVDDFIYFKKLSDVCLESGSYYDPCK